MTRCYKCLGQGVMGKNMNLYLIKLPKAEIPLPVHDKCASTVMIKFGYSDIVTAHTLAVFDNKGIDYRDYWVSFQKHLVRGIGITKHSDMLEQELKALMKKYKEGGEE